MTEVRKKTFSSFSTLWMALFLCAVLAAAALSFSYEVFRAKESVQKYVGIWEDDIARAKIFQRDYTLQNKILKQLKDVHPAVSKAEVDKPQSLSCPFFADIPVTYNSLPAASLRVCFRSSELIIYSLLSPVFMVGVLLGVVFLCFSLRREFVVRLQENKLQMELASNKEIASLSRQVAHDIRGPLTALTTLSRLSHDVSEDSRELLRLAVERIGAIAEDLLVKSSRKEDPCNQTAKGQSADLIALIESLLREYRFSFKEVEFRFHNKVGSMQVALQLEPIKLQRILSNLVNNSIEALADTRGTVDVVLLEKSGYWVLQILDNGKGIPSEILPKLAQEGVSHGKENGHGLGLYDAKKTLQAFGGILDIHSRWGVGTQVILQFPQVPVNLAKSL